MQERYQNNTNIDKVISCTEELKLVDETGSELKYRYILLQRGKSYYYLQFYQNAIDDFTNALKIHNCGGDHTKVYIEALFLRGRCYENLKEYYLAIKDMEQILLTDSFQEAKDCYKRVLNAYLHVQPCVLDKSLLKLQFFSKTEESLTIINSKLRYK